MKLTGRFYYSEKQRQHVIESRGLVFYMFDSFNRAIPKPFEPRRNFCELESGEIVEYTECASGEPVGNFDDFVFLGYGEYHHSETL